MMNSLQLRCKRGALNLDNSHLTGRAQLLRASPALWTTSATSSTILIGFGNFFEDGVACFGRQNNSFLFELLRFDAGVAAAFGGGEDPGTSSASPLRGHCQFVRETQSTCTMVPNVSPSSGGEEKRLQEPLPITPSRRLEGRCQR
jgi:hypothetical protein